MRLVIGDIHGCLTSLETLIEVVQPKKSDLIVTLGDYVDRGPDSKGVIDYLLNLQQTHETICLMGNHEIQMLRALETKAGPGTVSQLTLRRARHPGFLWRGLQ